MSQPQFKHIYGPVHSWRMGMSLGIDPISTVTKVCNFNCTYCQLGCAGHGGALMKRAVFVAAHEVIEELKALGSDVRIDHLTFSGNGEPTLAANLGEMITLARQVRPEKVAVITNGTLLGDKDVANELRGIDLILVKLEAADDSTLSALNQPAQGITMSSILTGIKSFRAGFKGRFALQIMFVDKNRHQAEAIARLAREIAPDEIQLNTPLRPSSEKPLTPPAMAQIKTYFAGLNVRSVYEEEKKEYRPIDEQATFRRHGEAKR